MTQFSQYRVLIPGKINDIVCKPDELIDAEDIHPASLNSALQLGIIQGVESVEETEVTAKGQRKQKAPPKAKPDPDPVPEPTAETEFEATTIEPGETEAK